MNMWDERYNGREYFYGTEPNIFFSEQLRKLTAGSLLLPCEGEGRNAIFAAKNGWDVHCFDLSLVGMQKAISLAESNNVTVNYFLQDANMFQANQEFDVCGLIYSHFNPEFRERNHSAFVESMKPGGLAILEAFNKKQITLSSGGPKDIDMLYSIEVLKNDFKSLDIEYLEEMEVELDEGDNHKGYAEIIRMIARKRRK